ncbi:MAG: DUF1924 domain-containing protein [Candidatus Thiodiazotropha sp.]
MKHTAILLSGLCLCLPVTGQADSVTERLNAYEAEGAGNFSAQDGAQAWTRQVAVEAGALQRSCQDCHGERLTGPGKHVKTGRAIDPMAPSVNSRRLADGRKIEKWFRRNCQWTWGRTCTAQEKGDILRFLQQQ